MAATFLSLTQMFADWKIFSIGYTLVEFNKTISQYPTGLAQVNHFTALANQGMNDVFWGTDETIF